MTKKQLLRSVAFLLVLSVMLVTLCDLYEQENVSNSVKRLYTYRKLNDDTVDAVIIGTSGIDRYFISAQAYEEYGYTLYPIAVDAMAVWLLPEVLEFTRTYQDPELFIIDIRPFTQVNTNANTLDVRARRILDALPQFSPLFIKCAFKAMEITHEADPTKSRFDLSYLFSFIKYHSMWEDENYLVKENLGPRPHEYLGYYVSSKATVLNTPIKNVPYNPYCFEDLDPTAIEYLYKVIDYIRENDLNVLFIDTPQTRKESEMGRSNTIYQILEEEGMPYLHYYTDKNDTGISIDFDYSRANSDFYNEGHLNFYGATKFTKILGKYIDDNYDLPDRRNDEAVKEDWDGVYDSLLEKVDELEKIEARRAKKSKK